MEIQKLVRQVALGDSAERERATHILTTQILTAEESKAEHYASLLDLLAETADSYVAFWCLELLVKKFGSQLQQGARRAIPQLLTALLVANGPVVDRAAWALSSIGPDAVEALLQAIATAPDTRHTKAYIGALRANRSVYALAKPVLALLAARLSDPSEEIRFWAMTVLMDISPLRPWFDERMSAADFEPLYGPLLAVAQAFVDSGQQEFEFAARYVELLTRHLSR